LRAQTSGWVCEAARSDPLAASPARKPRRAQATAAAAILWPRGWRAPSCDRQAGEPAAVEARESDGKPFYIIYLVRDERSKAEEAHPRRSAVK